MAFRRMCRCVEIRDRPQNCGLLGETTEEPMAAHVLAATPPLLQPKACFSPGLVSLRTGQDLRHSTCDLRGGKAWGSARNAAETPQRKGSIPHDFHWFAGPPTFSMHPRV